MVTGVIDGVGIHESSPQQRVGQNQDSTPWRLGGGTFDHDDWGSIHFIHPVDDDGPRLQAFISTVERSLTGGSTGLLGQTQIPDTPWDCHICLH